MNTIRINLGERREIAMSVNVNGSAITPSTPTYRLILGDTVVDSGSMTVADDVISAMIEPTTVGQYTLEVTFGVGVEILIRKVAILVLS